MMLKSLYPQTQSFVWILRAGPDHACDHSTTPGLSNFNFSVSYKQCSVSFDDGSRVLISLLSAFVKYPALPRLAGRRH